jgi:hypothetical protein
MPFGKLLRKRDAARARAAAQQSSGGAGERPSGFSRTLSRIVGRPAGDVGMDGANMGAPIMSGDVDAMMGRGAQRDMSTMKKGGKVKKMAKGGSTASKRADGCATKGKTRGKLV